MSKTVAATVASGGERVDREGGRGDGGVDLREPYQGSPEVPTWQRARFDGGVEGARGDGGVGLRARGFDGGVEGDRGDGGVGLGSTVASRAIAATVASGCEQVLRRYLRGRGLGSTVASRAIGSTVASRAIAATVASGCERAGSTVVSRWSVDGGVEEAVVIT